MKLLVLSNLFPPHYLGGYEVICHTVTRALRDRGHSVHVLTANHRVPENAHLGEEMPVERSLRIHGFYGHPWLGILKLRILEQHNNQMLRRAIRSFKPDLVYVWNMGGLSKSMLFTLQTIGIPTVFYISDHWIARGLTSDVWLRWWNESRPGPAHRVARALFRTAGLERKWRAVAPADPPERLQFRRIYFCSRALRDRAAAAGFPVEHGAVIYVPVDCDHYQGVPRPADQPAKRFLYVGRLAEDKGTMTALKALARLKGKLDIRLNVYGWGEAAYERVLFDYAKKEQLPVTFGTATMEEMPRIYRDHNALLFTSEWEEPFALTPIEAMACGLPVIGTTTGGSAELFRDRENALTYRAGDPDGLAARIEELTRDDALRHRCAVTGWREARARFSSETIVDAIEDYLEESLKVWKPAVPIERAA